MEPTWVLIVYIIASSKVGVFGDSPQHPHLFATQEECQAKLKVEMKGQFKNYEDQVAAVCVTKEDYDGLLKEMRKQTKPPGSGA